MRTRVSLSLVCLSAALCGAAFLSSPGLAQEPTPNIYTLDSILDLALARNPVVSSAEGLIDRQRGQKTAAGAASATCRGPTRTSPRRRPSRHRASRRRWSGPIRPT